MKKRASAWQDKGRHMIAKRFDGVVVAAMPSITNAEREHGEGDSPKACMSSPLDLFSPGLTTGPCGNIDAAARDGGQ